MPNLGMGELLIILVIVLLVFGASRLPQIGEGMGKAIRGLKRGLQENDDIEVTPAEKRVAKKSGAEEIEDAKVSDAEVVEKKS